MNLADERRIGKTKNVGRLFPDDLHALPAAAERSCRFLACSQNFYPIWIRSTTRAPLVGRTLNSPNDAVVLLCYSFYTLEYIALHGDDVAIDITASWHGIGW